MNKTTQTQSGDNSKPSARSNRAADPTAPCAWPDRIAPFALLLGGLLTLAGFLLAFLFAPPVLGAEVSGVELIGGRMVANVLLLSQKIFYFHMPVAIVSFAALVFAGYLSLRFLLTRQMRLDTQAQVAMEVALVFVLATMATGEMWTRFEWGTWWTWDPRLTTYLILILIVVAYFILRTAIDDKDRRAAYSAVLSIIALIDVPICYLVTLLIPSSLHPVVLRSGGMTADMGMTVAVALLGMVLVGFSLYYLRNRQIRLAERVETIKKQLDGQREE